VNKKKIDLLRSLEMALDMLDRVEGTSLYEIQKRLNGYSDKEYHDMIEQLASIYNYFKNKDKNQ
jgi:hypothetical protein